jgi:hypothetical protein
MMIVLSSDGIGTKLLQTIFAACHLNVFHDFRLIVRPVRGTLADLIVSYFSFAQQSLAGIGRY